MTRSVFPSCEKFRGLMLAAVMALATALTLLDAGAQLAEVFRDPLMLQPHVGNGLVYEERFERAPYLAANGGRQLRNQYNGRWRPDLGDELPEGCRQS